jgi:hypothetical protein
LACMNKLMMNNAFTVKKDHWNTLDIWPDLPCFLWMWRGQSFPLRGLGFWVLSPVNDHREEVLAISGFIQLFLADKHTPLLLLIGEQPRYKLHGDLLHIQVLC